MAETKWSRFDFVPVSCKLGLIEISMAIRIYSMEIVWTYRPIYHAHGFSDIDIKRPFAYLKLPTSSPLVIEFGKRPASRGPSIPD